MYEVSIPMANFIEQWSDDDSEFMKWMTEEAGLPVSDWKARGDPTKVDYAIFCFEDRNTAIKFRLTWA